MIKKSTYHVIGLMSGTSLDGLDVVHCTLSADYDQKWSYTLNAAETIPYGESLAKQLSAATEFSGLELAKLHVQLGRIHGQWVKEFLVKHNLHTDFIASHGHTIFHQPELSLTLQIGSAPHIAAATLLPVVSDFRTLDVACNGQGAPLVPMGDALLFGDYDACLNLGGIANITLQKNTTTAFDICACNMGLNYLAERAGLVFDEGGRMAKSGKVIPSLLDLLNQHPYYSRRGPKSLGKEFFTSDFQPLMQREDYLLNDALTTVTEHIARQIASILNEADINNVLVTGGGAFNTFLIERVRAHTRAELIIPDKNIIQFKEALVFGLLGALRWREEPNCLSAVTGANSSVCGGSIYLPPQA